MLEVDEMYSSIDAKELKGLIGRVNIIDIRENYLHNIGSIPTSVNIPSSNLYRNQDYLKMNETYYIYCSYGFSSAKMCHYLSGLGYKVVNVIGGYNSFLNS